MPRLRPVSPSARARSGTLTIAVLAIAATLLPPSAAADGTTAPRTADRVVAVDIVSAVGGSAAPADPSPKRARADAGVTLYAVLTVGEGRTRRYYSDAGTVRLGGRVHRTAPLADAPPATLRWYKVEPTSDNLSNTASGSFRFETIPYREVQVSGWTGKGTVTADVRPTLTPDRGDGVGTMRYRLVAVSADGAVATPGVEARRGRGAGGLTDDVHRVSLRRDDSFLGYLTEMYGQPYIWASAGTTDAAHQSERLEGSDCADFVVYGWRRLGRRVPYTWTGGLHRYTRSLGKGTLGDDGIYRDRRGRPLPFPEIGDLVLFPRHVGVLTADRGVPGVLDSADLMMHTLFASPLEEPIADSGYAGTPIEILRYRGP
jgi:hypothetical protein